MGQRITHGPLTWYRKGDRWCCFTPWGSFRGQDGFYPLIPRDSLTESLNGDIFEVMYECAGE